MVSMLDSIVVERGFQPRFGQTKDYKIAICCISAKHAALRSKSKTGWLRIRMFEWSIRSTRDCCYIELDTIKVKLSILV